MKHKAIELDPRKLVVSEQYQARKTTSQTPLPQLADSIATVGLLHALAVVKSKKRGLHEVIAGGRRLQAIHHLLEDGRWPEGQLVAGNLYDEENALLVSITENVQREQMHPADEFEAFAELIGQGKTIEDVAAAFGVTATVVRRRLQLGRVAPALMQAYRDNELPLDALMAYAMTDNQERQPKQKRPFFVSKAYGKLKPNIVYVRRGSSTDEADPTEVGDMVLADSGRGSMQLDLSVLATDNEPLPETFALRYLQFSEKLPDYESRRKSDGYIGISMRSSIWHDNKDFWREYAEYAVVDGALIEMKFVLHNRSETQLSNAKLEISIESLDGQGFQIFPGMDIPEMPESQCSPMGRSLPDLLERRDACLVVDHGGVTPLCHVRFGTLLPGEEGRSTDSLAIVPSGPGKFRLKFRILAGELSAPQEVEQIIEATGETVVLNADALDELYG